jgi:RNA polymerase sigma-70 factor (ECF subfamily)
MALTANSDTLLSLPAHPVDEEHTLVMLLSKGDERAFEKIYHLYSERLLGNLIKIVKSETLACELLQDTFVKVWSNRQKLDPNQSFRSYLFRIAANLTYDFFRKAARDNKLQSALISASTYIYDGDEEGIYSNENVQLLHEAINALPEQRRLVFQLIKLEGKSYIEVSRLLHISTSTISDHIVKATKSIRKQMGSSHVTAISILLFLLLN